MKSWFEVLSRQVNAKKAVWILSLIIVFHLLFMLYLVQNTRSAQQAARRSALFQKVVNIIYLVEATPEQNRAAAVAAIEDPDLQVKFTDKPLWSLQFEQASFWKIVQTIEKNASGFSLSIKMDKDQWLNIKAAVYTHLLTTQLISMLIELVVFGSILVALLSINRFTKPLKKIKISAERLGIDLETKPMDIYGPPVVREVSQALNQMQKRILQLIRTRTQMLAAISHDLRTPIMRARLRLQFIPESEHKSRLLNDLEEMERMISETLSFAREDSRREEKKAIDLVSLIRSICNDAVDLGHKVSFESKIQRVAFDGRPLALKRAFTNLIYNAIRYAGNAQVSVIKRGKKVFVMVEDDGPGIPAADLDRVFEPFYRAERSRSRETGGVGLGLAVTRDIIRAHHGKINIKNKKPHGLRVWVGFTLAV